MYNKCDFELQNVKPEIAALTANELFVVFCVDFCVLVSNGYLYSHWFFFVCAHGCSVGVHIVYAEITSECEMRLKYGEREREKRQE